MTVTTADIATGVHLNVPPEEYHAWYALGSTDINDLFEAPIDYAYWRGKTREDTEAKICGTVLHTAVWEPDQFDRRYVVRDKKDLPGGAARSNAAKAQWKEWHDEAAKLGHTVITQDDYDLAARMRDSVHGHPAAGKLLAMSAEHEVSLRWDIDDLACKGRIDCLPDNAAMMVDVKTTRSAQPRKFGYSIRDYGYDVQACWYLDGLKAIEEASVGAVKREYFIIAVEKTGPCKVSVFQLSDDLLNLARAKVRESLETYHKCTASGHWPSYSDQIIKLNAKCV